MGLSLRIPSSILTLTLLYLSSTTTTTAQEISPLSSSQAAIATVAIQQIINLQATAVDQRRFDLLSQVFTPDVTVNFNNPGMPILHGLDAVTAFISTSLQDIVSYHAQSTHYVNLTDTAGPHATTYNTATFFGVGRQQGVIGTRLGR